MKKLPNFSKITYSSEFFSKMNSKFSNLLIYIIGIFILIFCGWIFLGKCEDVVSATGVVRPIGNISSVYSIITGKIDAIHFSDSQTVKKDDLLFTLQCEAEKIAKKNIEEKIELINKKIFEINLMIESHKKNKNLINPLDYVSHTRMKIYFDMIKDMKELSEIYKHNYETQKLLPENLISSDDLRNSERIWLQSKISISQFSENFLAQLIIEKENHYLQFQTLDTNLAEINKIIENSHIRAPIDGKIFVLEKIHENDFIYAQQHILSIVPETENGYEIVVRVNEKDIKDIYEGLTAKVKFNAYRNSYEYILATIKHISPDTLSNGNTLFYLVTLLPDKKDIFEKLEKIELKSGLQANAKIILNEQNIISYIIKKMEINL